MNKQIKIEMIKADLKQFQLAKLLGIHEANLSKLLNRNELSIEKKNEIIDVIRRGEKNARRRINNKI